MIECFSLRFGAVFLLFSVTSFACYFSWESVQQVRAVGPFFGSLCLAALYSVTSLLRVFFLPRTAWCGAFHALVLSCFLWLGVVAAVSSDLDAGVNRSAWLTLAVSVWSVGFAVSAFAIVRAFSFSAQQEQEEEEEKDALSE